MGSFIYQVCGFFYISDLWVILYIRFVGFIYHVCGFLYSIRFVCSFTYQVCGFF